MYPDPITPRAHPDLLSRLDYDPFNVMPATLPAGPRVFTTAGHVRRARERIAAGGPVDRHCFNQLIAACKIDEPLPQVPEANGKRDWRGALGPAFNLAFRNALAWRLTDDTRHRERALEALRLGAEASQNVRAWSGHEHHEAHHAASAYDLLAADGLKPLDDNRFRDMLWVLINAMDLGEHKHCNNHNSMQMVGRLSLGAALGHTQTIHDTLYGCERRGRWRYGLVHLMRHDFLADGMQWEGAPGYHMLVLMMVCECFTVMENIGVDLWRRQWPALVKDDGFDEHRSWGPKGNKTISSAFDALLYQAFSNGDYSLVHDQVLGNLRGAWVWWLIFNKAYEVFGEPRYAWALQQINRGVPATADGPVPAWFEGRNGDVEFVRFEARDIPAGKNPLEEDRDFSLTGKHVAGCSLFPAHGSALLRSDAANEKSLGAYLYWGPHNAGHRSPAALHLDIHAQGRRATTAAHVWAKGYDEPRHLTWHRSTIAYNTVTVDQRPMFPFDFETNSLWECDLWRDTNSDGVLESFQPSSSFKSVRASNDNVYAGVKLDRAVILTGEYLLDVYRVIADRPRLLDWAIHCHGEFAHDASVPVIDLGQNRGYRHFTDAKVQRVSGVWAEVPYTFNAAPAMASLWLGGAPDAKLILARDPAPDDRTPIGDAHQPEPRTTLMVRSQAASALFVSVWSFGAVAARGVHVQGNAEGDVVVAVKHGEKTHHWALPGKGAVSLKSV